MIFINVNNFCNLLNKFSCIWAALKASPPLGAPVGAEVEETVCKSLLASLIENDEAAARCRAHSWCSLHCNPLQKKPASLIFVGFIWNI